MSYTNSLDPRRTGTINTEKLPGFHNQSLLIDFNLPAMKILGLVITPIKHKRATIASTRPAVQSQ